MKAAVNLCQYEISLQVETSLAEKLDEWLDDYAAGLRATPGLTEVTVWSVYADPQQACRVLRLCAESTAHLLDYRDNQSQPAVAEFHEIFAGRWRGRLLHPGIKREQPVAAVEHCLNCGAVLGSQYCSQCGQRAQTRLISIWGLIHEAFGDLFDFDSRLWRTLIPLAIRPGFLTAEYLRGRRTHYMPPFRMYLVMSVVFFVVAFFDPYEDLGVLFEPATIAAREQREAATLSEGDERAGIVTLNSDGNASGCDLTGYDPELLPGWLARRLTEERLRAACRAMVDEDSRRGILDQFVDNIPTALFILLPLLALVLRVLYPFASRYYVEHLLFVVHFHTFCFMLLGLNILFGRLALAAGIINEIKVVTDLAVSAYVPIYFYRAQRRVYGQGHLATGLKWALMFMTYIVGIGAIMALSALIAIFAA